MQGREPGSCPGFWLFRAIRDLQQHIGMAWSARLAPARQIFASQLFSHPCDLVWLYPYEIAIEIDGLIDRFDIAAERV